MSDDQTHEPITLISTRDRCGCVVARWDLPVPGSVVFGSPAHRKALRDFTEEAFKQASTVSTVSTDGAPTVVECPHPDSDQGHLERHVELGLLSAEQAAAIEADNGG